jgi:hypothetical protein
MKHYYLISISSVIIFCSFLLEKNRDQSSGFVISLVASDTTPAPKTIASKYFNSKMDSIVIVYTDGSKESITAAEAEKRNIELPHIVEWEDPHPSVKRVQEVMDSGILIEPPPPPFYNNNEPKNPSDTLYENTIFKSVEIEPTVDKDLWTAHLQIQLQPAIDKALKQNMPEGIYTVPVRFVVEKNGSVTDITALTDPGYGLKEASIKAVQTGPAWKPGSLHGKLVRSYKVQPITFIVRK